MSSPKIEAARTSPAPSAEAPVTMRGVSKQFTRAGGAGTVQAVDRVSIDVQRQELLVLLGPSGCGKSTLLRCLAGLEYPDAGSISIAGEKVFDSDQGVVVPPNERDLNMMFQSYALWPHMTLEANVAYPLRVRGVKKANAVRTANEYLDLVGLNGLGKQYAGAVSGGQAQRVALARTLISEPAVVLFDEPLSNVDAKVRARLRGELTRIHQELGFSGVYVTHDQVEALGVATRIAVMRSGRIEQVATPIDIYDRPVSRYAAEFIGEANFIEGRLSDVSAVHWTLSTRIGDLRIQAPEHGELRSVGDELTIMVRPEYIGITRNATRDAKMNSNMYRARVDAALYAGFRTEYTAAVGTEHIQAWDLSARDQLNIGDEVVLRIPEWAPHVLSGD